MKRDRNSEPRPRLGLLLLLVGMQAALAPGCASLQRSLYGTTEPMLLPGEGPAPEDLEALPEGSEVDEEAELDVVAGDPTPVFDEAEEEQAGLVAPDPSHAETAPEEGGGQPGVPDPEAEALPDGTPLAGEATPAAEELPFVELSDAEIERLLDNDPAALGPMSLGYTNAGALMNGVQMPESDRWIVRSPGEAWGTQETIDFLIAAIDKVHEQFPGTPRLFIGDLSHRRGGRMGRHLSHQAGRDVDLGWYYAGGESTWYTPGTERTLDVPRTWALVRALITETDAQLILIDSRIQRLLYAHALAIGEDKQWLDSVMQYPGGRWNTLCRNAPGHHTHMHVRFYNRKAQEMGRRAYRFLLARKMLRPPTYYVAYKVKQRDTLGQIARRFGTTVKAIQQANGLRSTLIRAGRTYRIPRRGGVAAPLAQHVPPRRLPPAPPAATVAARSEPIRIGGQERPERTGPPDIAIVATPPAPIIGDAEPLPAAAATPQASRPMEEHLSHAGPAAPPSELAAAGRSLGDLAVARAATTAEPSRVDQQAVPVTTGPVAAAAGQVPDAAEGAAPAPAAPPAGAAAAAPATAAAAAAATVAAPPPPPPVKPAPAARPAKPASAVKKAAPRRPTHRWITYKVRPGDNPWTIARRNNVKVEQVLKWNHLKPDHLIQPGQRLRLYVSQSL